MKSNSASVLGLMLLACFLSAAPARAEDTARSCDVLDDPAATESSLPKVAEAIEKGIRWRSWWWAAAPRPSIQATAALPGRLQALRKEAAQGAGQRIRRTTDQKTAEEVAPVSPSWWKPKAYFGHLADRNLRCYSIHRSR
jgi:hypothetical protein